MFTNICISSFSISSIFNIGKDNNALAKNAIVFQEQSFPSILSAASDTTFADFSLPSYSDSVKEGAPKSSLSISSPFSESSESTPVVDKKAEEDAKKEVRHISPTLIIQ